MSAEHGLESSPPIASVRDLVRRRVGVDGDTWNLALVQRDEVWLAPRMLKLLDSLIAGYPIGALLLCRVATESMVIARSDGVRHVIEAGRSDWQLLDGQQRINALFSMFTDKGGYGRFYVHMTMVRQTPQPGGDAWKSGDLPRYLAWRDMSDVDLDDPLDDRGLHLELSGWFEWASRHDNELVQFKRQLDEDPSIATRLLREIDGEFTPDLDDVQTRSAADRLGRLIDVWVGDAVPILRTEVEDPLDVLEVFTRINLGGVQIVGADVYFAAVKTFWPDAEAHIDRLSRASEFLSRRSALRFASRLASISLGQGDILQLTVDRLAGTRGALLIEALQTITADGAPALERIAAFNDVYIERSRLGHGLRLIRKDLWDEVLAWVSVSPRNDREWWEENVRAIDEYVLGAHLFRYVHILGERFQRAAFREAVAAGIQGMPFPLERIVGVIRQLNPQLSGNRTAVRSLATEDDRLAIADSNVALLAGISQKLPYALERPIDWDHIYPSGRATRMWSLSKYGRRMRHPHRHFVNSAGNLWALDASTNRALQAAPPSEKFRLLEESLRNGGPFAIWPRENWSIDEAQVREYIEIEKLLTDDEQTVARGMERFRSLVVERSERLLAAALQQFPRAALFASDADIQETEASADSAAALAARFDLEEVIVKQTRETNKEIIGGSEGHPLDDTPLWQRRGGELHYAVTESVRRHANLRGKPESITRGGWGNGFDWRRYVLVGAPDPATHFYIGVVKEWTTAAGTPFWLQVPKDSPGFPTVEVRLSSSKLSPQIRRDGGNIWLPLPVDNELMWGEVAGMVFNRALEIRGFIESGEGS